MKELNKDIVGNDLENLLKNQKSFEEQQELERQRIQKLLDQQRSEYYSKFAETYRNIIKPCFGQFTEIFEKNGHNLILRDERLDETNVRPEVQFDLLVNSENYNSVQIYIMGKGRNENVFFYLVKNNNKYEKSFQYEQIIPKVTESTLVQALSMQTK